MSLITRVASRPFQPYVCLQHQTRTARRVGRVRYAVDTARVHLTFAFLWQPMRCGVPKCLSAPSHLLRTVGPPELASDEDCLREQQAVPAWHRLSR